jgi:dTMP kinase
MTTPAPASPDASAAAGPSHPSGALIVLEGLDGAGTTTQARWLVDRLRASDRAAHLTREPSDGPIGRLIRDMLGGHHRLPSGEAIGQDAFTLLFAADRLDHLQREVEPAIAAGALVVSDRYYHSSLAYQGTGAARAWIMTLNERARRPDLTIFLRVGPEVAAARRRAAGRTDELFEDAAMQARVATGYESVLGKLAADGEAIVILDGERPLEDVAAAILAAVEERWPAAPPPAGA